MAKKTPKWQRIGAWLLIAAMLCTMQLLPVTAAEGDPAQPHKLEQSLMKATASQWGTGDGPENTIDGDTNAANGNGKSVWASWGRGDDTQAAQVWIMLELDKVHEVAALQMTGRSNTSEGFVTKYDLDVSEDGETFETIQTDGTFAVPSDGVAVSHAFAAGTKAKFIKLTVKDCVRRTGGNQFWPAISNLDVFVTDVEPQEPEPSDPQSPETIWPTPVLPPQAKKVEGVAEPVILLSDPEGSGLWQFLFDLTGTTKPADTNFDFASWDSLNWEDIKVPGEPLMQGWDILANTEYYYRTTFTVPADYEDQAIRVRFRGVYSDARVWVNGQYVRKHVGGFTSWDCDLTDLVTPGETVTMVVGVTDNRSNPSYASTYAHHNIGGILRDVELMALPQEHLQSMHLETELDETFTDAELKLDLKLNQPSNTGAKAVFTVLDGTQVKASGEAAFAAGEQKMQFVLPVASPKLWDAEHPNLYTLRTELVVDGKTVQTNEQSVGFREITFGGADGTDVNKIYVNGSPVKLRGTCRHDISADLGRSITKEHIRAELQAYKEANINFVRTSHYPPDDYFLQVCDELGIYVEDETAICFDYSGSSRVESDYMDQFTEMIEAHRNHASVLYWSMGNESFHSGNASFYQKEWDYAKATDTTRPVTFSWPDQSNNGNIYYDIYSSHYPSYNLTGGAGYGKPEQNYTERPVVHDEYAHIPCYNLSELQSDPNVRNFWGESIKIFWDNIMGSGNVPEEYADGSAGGALWGGIDDVFYIPEGTTERYRFDSTGDVAGYGEWGSVLDVYLREKPEAWLTKKAYSPIRVDVEDIAAPEAGQPLVLQAENRFDHTNFTELTMEYQVNGGETKTVRLSSVAPRAKGTVTVPAQDWKTGDVISLKFYTDFDGIMVDQYSITLGGVQPVLHTASEDAPEVQEQDGQVVVRGTDFSVIFSKQTAQIASATFKGTELLSGGPKINALGSWTPAEENAVTYETVDNHVVVHLLGSCGSTQVRFDVSISGNGILETTYTILGELSMSGLKEVGLVFDLAYESDSVSWLRDGLWSVYPEDHIGRNSGTAYKVRPDSETDPDQYGVKPTWSWKDDMRNFFLFPKDSEEDGNMTNDFKATRENVWYYDILSDGSMSTPHVSVESEDASVAAYVRVFAEDPSMVDDRDSRIVYTGGWGTYDGSSDYKGTETFSTKLGDYCEFSFNGTGVRWIGAKQTNTGKAKVYVDGELVEEVDTYNTIGSTQLKQQIIFTVEGLDPGEHTIKVETSGGRANCVVIDAFEVITNEVQETAESLQLTVNNQWCYPDLSWGNYCGVAGSLKTGSTGSATLVLTDWDRVSVEEPEEPTLDGIEITTQPAKTSYKVGETFDPAGMVVTARYSDNTTQAVTDYTFEPAGALALGDTTVTVTYQGKTATVAITVTKPDESVPVTGVTLDKSTLSLTEGKTGTLIATVVPDNATNSTVTWTSSNEAVVTVANGVVTAVAPGTATITVTTEDGGFTASCVVHVKTISITPPDRPSDPSKPSVPVLPEMPFVDVLESAWYYDSVKAAWEKGLIDGMTETQFEPDSTLTVAQAIKLAAALEQLYREGSVTLTNGSAQWYDSYVDYAVEQGVIEEDYQAYTKAYMDAPITREEFVHILYGALHNAPAINQVAENAIPDVKSGGKYAAEIYEFYRAGITNGTDEQGTFRPASSIKRSEVAAILIRMFDPSVRVSITLN